MDQNDHDILIEVKTMVNILVQNQERYFTEHKELDQRVTRLETLQGTQSAEIKSLSDNLDRLQKKSSLFDGLNALGIAISTVLAFFLGHK